MTDSRPDPDLLLAKLKDEEIQARRGKLKLFFGASAGVGKTFTGGWSVSAAGAGANNNRFYRPPVGGLSFGNGETRNVNKPVLILQVGRTF